MPTDKSHLDTNDIHTEEVNDIIGHTPGILVRYGMVGFLLVLVLSLAASWLITYPDTVTGACTIYATTAPKPLVPRTNGRLEKLFVAEGDSVKANQLMLLIQSTANYEEVQKLAHTLSQLWKYVQQDEWEKISISPVEYKNLGELQGALQNFYSSFIQLNSFILSGQYDNKRHLARRDLINNDSLRRLLLKQKVLHERDYAIAQSDFSVKQLLFNEKVIAKVELTQEESKVLAKKLPLEAVDASLMNNSSASVSKEREIMELDNQYYQTKSGFIQSLNKLVSDIESWKQQYLINAPMDGIVTFTKNVQENQELSSGEPVFYIESGTNACYAEVLVDQANFGKVQRGQMVILRLQSYPFQEFGSLQGIVAAVSRIPVEEKQFIVKVMLPEGLRTDMGNSLRFTNELVADAQIVTKKTRLLYKFFSAIRGIFH